MIHHTADLSISTSSQQVEGRFETPSSFTGNGFTVEGTMHKVRNHTLNDQTKRRTRFIALEIDVKIARNRAYNEKGEEKETEFKREKLVGKGYLNKYDHVEIQDPYKISSDEMAQRLSSSTAALPPGYHDNGLEGLHPNTPNRFEFWCDVRTYKHSDFKEGEQYRLKSISSLSKLSRNYAGEDVKGGWDSQVNRMKTLVKEEGPLPGEDVEGVDDDEWD